MYCIAFHIFFCNKKLSKYVNNFGKMLRCILAEKRKTTNGLHSDLNVAPLLHTNRGVHLPR
nr:hypothetical protein Iba_chr14fCG4420 [Ipomoea batatas]